MTHWTSHFLGIISSPKSYHISLGPKYFAVICYAAQDYFQQIIGTLQNWLASQNGTYAYLNWLVQGACAAT